VTPFANTEMVAQYVSLQELIVGYTLECITQSNAIAGMVCRIAD